jgi:RNA recognition motif-containing protein
MNILFIGNTPNSESDALKELNKKLYEQGNCKIKHKEGYAFAEFEKKEDAEKAIEALNGIELDEKKLRVEWGKRCQESTKPRERRSSPYDKRADRGSRKENRKESPINYNDRKGKGRSRSRDRGNREKFGKPIFNERQEYRPRK